MVFLKIELPQYLIYVFLLKKILLCASMIQVEVKIDNSLETSKGCFLNKFSIEAGLFDHMKWHASDECCGLTSSFVARMELNSSSSNATFGFLGYVLVGKLKSPKLWSAEQVRNLSIFMFSP